MKIARLTTVVLAAVVAMASAEPARAQFYGGIGYGGHHHSGFYGGSYASGAYPFNNWYVGPYRVLSPGYVGTGGYGFGYTRNYGLGAVDYGIGYGPGYGLAGPVVVAPPVYGTTTTIIRGGPTGGVIQYTHNGNGYTYVPNSNYPTVIQQQPTLGLSRTVVVPSPPPVVIESRPQGSTYGLQGPSGGPASASNRPGGTIKLVCPKNAGGGLSYSLNGHVYTIQPGYSQTFRDDRPWTLEFKRGGDDSNVARYTLKAGTYTFVVGAEGWDLTQPGGTPASDLPPAPLPDTNDASTPPLPDLSTTPSLPPSPLPPP